jgi:uncharacterized protein
MKRLLLLLTLAAAPAGAASFDCGKAQTADEVAICRTPALSSADSEMGALFYAYGKVPMMMGSNGARHDDAEAFLARRRTCGGNAACIGTAYAERITALKSGIDAAMQDYFRLQNSPPPCPSEP